MDTQPVKDIFKRDDGGPVEPPDNMKALFDEITLAVDRYIKAGSDCIGTCITESEESTNDDTLPDGVVARNVTRITDTDFMAAIFISSV